MERPSRDGWLALALVAAMLGLIELRYRAPAPLPADAPESQFSAGRAREQLRMIAGDGRPRPVGSEASAQVREGILQRLRELGYAPEVQDGFACSEIQTCARVRNVTALRPGREEGGKLVVISAHYDSVPAGPGASDDGVGAAAVLEIARALKGEAPARNGVLILLNEGEEPGLIGSEAFTADHPLARRAGAVVNLEARGTGGPSLMFETSGGNGRLIELYADAVERPATNSIYYTVYKTLPNDTDLTIYKRMGMAGLNFAFIEGEVRYHTPLDDFAHADPGSLQHHGQNALGMVRALAAADLDQLQGEEAVFFDLFTFTTLHWPERWMGALGILAAALVAVAVVVNVRRGHVRGTWVALGALGWLLAMAGTAGVELGNDALLRAAEAFPYDYLARPWPARMAFWAAALAVAVLFGSAFHGSARRMGLWLGALSAWGALSAAIGVLQPGLSYPVILPTLVAAPLAILFALRAPRGAAAPPRWVWIPPFLAAGTLWLPIGWVLYEALGVYGLLGGGGVFGLVLGLVAPVWGRFHETRPLLLATLLAWGAGLGLAVISPRFTEDHPRKVNLEYQLVAADGVPAVAKWVALPLTDDLPEGMGAAGRFGEVATTFYPWPSQRKGFVAEAPVLSLPPPSFSVQSAKAAEGRLVVQGTLSSPRGALEAGLVVPAARLKRVRVNGKAPPEHESKNLVPKVLGGAGWVNVMTFTTGVEGASYELELEGTDPAEVYAWDSTAGLPEEGKPILAARPANAVPYQMGDRTVVFRPLKLQP